ncbi:MAG: hypothetical protein AAFX52_05505 [Pseudomonadota bacterium]
MNRSLLLGCAAIVTAVNSVGVVLAEEMAAPTEFSKAIAETKPIFQYRLRYETVNQEEFAQNADALTSRIRAGFETGAWKNTKFLIDFDHIEAHVTDFNSTINGNTGFPVVPDPEVTELNRFQLTNTSIDDTVITLGRQRIIHDDARFIGNVGWRQNEQTFDGLRIVNKSVEGLTIDATYVDQVNRIFGDDSPVGTWESESVLIDVDYKLPIESAAVTVSGYSYLLDFGDDAPAASSQTYGFQVLAKKGLFSGKARYAVQSEYGEQPVDYNADYLNLEGTVAKSGFAGSIGYEVLGSDDGVKAFSTPLATLHKFNGFADLFLGTPANGLEDFYGTVSYTTKNVGPAKLVKAFATYHEFSSDVGDVDFGNEFNAVLVAKFGRTSVLFKYADYKAEQFSGDRAKFWAQIDWTF